MLDRTQSAAFIESFDAMARRVAFIGALNSLVQLTLKVTLPGVPDFYQGTELWDLSLVDPDNRRGVDFSALSEMLHSLETPDWNALIASWPDGRIKMALTARLLRLRNEFSSVFLNGSYQPIEIGGADRDHVLAFTRSAGQVTILVAVGRHFASQARGSRPYDWDIEIQTARNREMTDLLNNSPSIGGRFFDSLPLRIWRVGVSGNQPSPPRKMELAT
jgi:(1->4)-alpha-D-glucan 1-alpha-D-glucosylmutase